MVNMGWPDDDRHRRPPEQEKKYLGPLCAGVYRLRTSS